MQGGGLDGAAEPVEDLERMESDVLSLLGSQGGHAVTHHHKEGNVKRM